VRPGREYDTTALREHGILPLPTAWTDDDLGIPGDLGDEGEADTITIADKKPKNRPGTDMQRQFNKAHHAVRAIGERGNSLLKTTGNPCPADVSRPGFGRFAEMREAVQ
jgi:hypothetical protein